MKARVKATGAIVEVLQYGKHHYLEYIGEKTGRLFLPEELEFWDEPDYWTRLKHQYAGMAMQALLSSETRLEVLSRRDNGTMEEEVAREAFDYAHALVQKMKEVRDE